MLSENGFNIKPARHYKKIEGGNVRCELCPRRCVIKPDHTGFCKSRKNLSGELYTLNYGKVSALHIDPIEKKPLYHFYPGSSILSAGTNYCNLACVYFAQGKVFFRVFLYIFHLCDKIFDGNLGDHTQGAGVIDGKI